MEPNKETKNICRACLTEEGTFQSIFLIDECPGLSFCISELITAFAKIQIIVGDGLPQQICTQCAEEVNNIYLFKLKCERSDMILRTRLKKNFLCNKKSSLNKDQAKTVQPLVNSKINDETDNNKEMCKKTNKLKLHEEFQCDICQEGFSQVHLLTSHKTAHAIKIEKLEISYEGLQENYNSVNQFMIKTEDSIFSCQECGSLFVQKHELENHISLHKKKESELDFAGEQQLNSSPKEEISSTSSISFNNKLVNINENPYKCDECKMSFLRLISLEKHKTIHTSAKAHQCDICMLQLSNAKNLVRHKKIHTGIKPFECDICQKKFLISQVLKVHKRSHTGEKPFQCDMCDKKYTTQDILKIHKRVHTGETPYECFVCKKKFTTSSNMLAHIKVHTGVKPHKCDICNKKFIKLSQVGYHKKIHERNKLLLKVGDTYQCDICKIKYFNSSDLASHITRVHTDKLFECDTCKNKFSTLKQMALHKKNHLNDTNETGKSHRRIPKGKRIYECDVCKSIFLWPFLLRDHLRTHTGEKPYECIICKKKFRIKHVLSVHMKIHSDEKPFECNICGKKFMVAKYLAGHQVTHTGEKLFECDVCERKFASTHTLHRHRKIHTGVKPFECDVCKLCFFRKEALRKHIDKH